MGVRAFTWRARRLSARLVLPVSISLVSVVCLLMPLGGCGGGRNPATGPVAAGVEYSGASGAGGREPPTAMELEAALGEEFKRLGIDPDKEVSAPASAGNAVFDLTARIVEEGELETGSPSGIYLTWTERLIGDYNQDSEVGVADLTPLGQRYDESVAYDDPEQHDGQVHWPTANPDDDGGVAPTDPPAPGSGADNWRLARIDGNADGLIYLSDITPIALHWQERLDGYRIFRWHDLTGETELVPHPIDLRSPLTIARTATFPPDAASPDPLRPVRYRFLDEVELGGTYKYYVAAYSLTDEAEGPPSELVEAYHNLAPQAMLTVTQQVAGLALCLFNASNSYDLDGEIVHYEWDLDDDGEFELDGGGASKLEHVFTATGLHTAAVRVTDNDGAQSTAKRQVFISKLIAAHFSASPTQGQAPLTVSFDPALSFSPNDIARYLWDLDGDGERDETRETPDIVQFTYKDPGEYRPTLEIRDAYDLTADYATTVRVEPPPGFSVTLSPVSVEGLPHLELYTATPWNAVEPVAYSWDLDGDGEFEHDSGENNNYSAMLTSPGLNTIVVRATDASGAIAFDTADNRVHAAPVAVLYVPDRVYGPREVVLNASGSHDDDDSIVSYHWQISGDDQWSAETSESSVTRLFDTGSYEIRVLVTDNYGYSDMADDHLAVLLDIDAVSSISLTADCSAGPPELPVAFHVEAQVAEDCQPQSLTLDTGDGTVYDFGTDLTADQSHTYAEGAYTAWATLTFRRKYHDYTNEDRLNIYATDVDVALIRNDGNIYDANYDALTSDLNALWGYTAYDWYAGIPADLNSTEWEILVWYRGGPGDGSEPQVYTTPWTDAEIDDYIQLMKDGHRVLLMSQSHGRNPGVDFDIELYGDGWQGWYGDQLGWQILSGSIDDEDIRHPWAASLGTDKAIGGTGQYGHLEAAPRNILATTGFGGARITGGYGDQPTPRECYSGIGSSGEYPREVSFGPGRQFTGIGYFWNFMKYHPYPNAGPNFEAGWLLEPAFEGTHQIAYISYGNSAAPDEDIGFLPDYSHTSGSGRLWVIGYPWAETVVTVSVSGEMTRADMLQNILAWLLTE